MDMTIRPILPEERKYTYAQSQQLMMQTGSIGHLRGDFSGSDGSFYTGWFDHVESRKTEAFKAELDDVINSLRFDEQYGGLLKNRASMQKCGWNQPDSAFEGSYTTEYSFRVDTDNFSYLLRCNPTKGDYNFYCWCFEKQWLNRHLQQAQKGIRFIDPNYKEVFRIPDGDKIRIIEPDGKYRDCVCRYIDEYHVEVSSGFDNLFHICQFAELMERNQNTVIPLRSSLPEQCLSTLPSTGELILIKKGEQGYSPSYDFSVNDPAQNREFADDRNAKNHVTKAQEAAMLAGSMFGWAVPAADPKNYDDSGQPVRPHRKDRGDAR